MFNNSSSTTQAKSVLPEIIHHPDLLDYQQAVDQMQMHVAAMLESHAKERLWFVEHPPVYTMGTSADASDLLSPKDIPVHTTGRGGEITYHGPGQRVVYVMLDLNKRGRDLRQYIALLEEWIIQALATFHIQGFIREGRVGVWVMTPDGRECKVAAIGVRVRRWITFHGIAINVDPDLSHYQGIVPCGISEYGVTSLKQLGVNASMSVIDQALIDSFKTVFSH